MPRKTAGTAARAALLAATCLTVATPSLAGVVQAGRDPNSPQIVDVANRHAYMVAVGFRRNGNSSVSACTGLMINARTVLTAAHCNVTGRPIIGYSTDPELGNDALRAWGRGEGGMIEAVNSVTNPAFYDSMYYGGDSGSQILGDMTLYAFGEARDVGRNASDLPGLLFSPIDRPVQAYVGGYGSTGTGDTGSTSRDNRRRVGTNMVDFLGSDRDLAVGIYANSPVAEEFVETWYPSGKTYQDYYWIDFDDLRNETAHDYDPLGGRDTVDEIGIGGGDSGGPLVTGDYRDVQGHERLVSLGVLSVRAPIMYEGENGPGVSPGGQLRHGRGLCPTVPVLGLPGRQQSLQIRLDPGR